MMTRLDNDLQRLRLRDRPSHFRSLQRRRAASAAAELLNRMDRDHDVLLQRLLDAQVNGRAGSHVLGQSVQLVESYRKDVERLVRLTYGDRDGNSD
jgi:hypothetical protein